MLIDNGILMSIYLITPIAFTVSIVRDLMYTSGNGTKYDLNDVEKGDIKRYMLILGKKFLYNFYLTFGVLSIGVFFVYIFDIFSVIINGEWLFFLNKDFYILLLMMAYVYEFKNSNKNNLN